MGNSPSKSNNTNFSVPNSSSNQQLTSSDDLNANEPSDPDDSGPISTINNNYEYKATKSGDNLNATETKAKAKMKSKAKTKTKAKAKANATAKTNVKDIPMANNQDGSKDKTRCLHPNANPATCSSTSADSQATMIHTPLTARNGKANFRLDLGVPTAKAFAISNATNCGGSDSSYSSNGSNNSTGSSDDTLFSPSPARGVPGYNANVTATSTDNANYLRPRTSNNRLNLDRNPSSASLQNAKDSAVFLKRYPHDAASNEGIDIDGAIEKLLKIGETRYYKSRDFPFSSWEIQLICYHVREIFLNQPSLLRLQAPIKVVGDVHGQFTDLMRILKLSGKPPETNYLFLGDYVDRGKQSLETILLLLCYKIKYKDNFFMLRGNHESANVTKMYGFFDECKRRTSSKTWKMFIDVFNTLPFAAIIQDRIFCVHGGISPELKSLKQLQRIVRPTDIPDEGLITDILWSDPDPQVRDWSSNDRGVSYIFGKKNVAEFCSNFNFDLVIRGHMVVEDGYEFFAKKKLVTIFSAPNYCGEFNNWGAVMSVTTGLMCSFELLKPRAGSKPYPKKIYSKSAKK